MTKALIIGGGIAGPTLAVALRRIGMEAEVFEQLPPDADQRGSWINFQANGLDALRAVGIESWVAEIGYPVDTISFVNGRGRSLGQMPMAFRRPDGLTSLMMPRARLFVALAEAARHHGIPVHHDKRLIDARDTGDGIIARFADGTEATGDILIGADGIHSTVRRLIDPTAPAPRYVPVLNTGGYIPDLTVDAPPQDFRMQFGTRCFFAWMNTPDGGTLWFANPPMKHELARGQLSGMSDGQWRTWLRELMDGDAGPSSSIIDAAPGPIQGWATYDMPVVKRWHDGSRMAIIGDAAHATSPAAGQGASMSLEDAVILAQCLRDCPTTASAFATFQSLRQTRVEKIVEIGHRSSSDKAAGPIMRVLRDLILPGKFRAAAKDGGEAMMWLQGHHIDFDERVVPAP
ncbi:FAD-dependent oxidoreductase [Microbacterium sp. NPDC012755]|uniref:FAD-dependent oxidoreductase n=1 Tax=Microbacterium sp. NPDC012755 TaxID=3364184 RepID=UPI0036B66F16